MFDGLMLRPRHTDHFLLSPVLLIFFLSFGQNQTKIMVIQDPWSKMLIIYYRKSIILTVVGSFSALLCNGCCSWRQMCGGLAV